MQNLSKLLNLRQFKYKLDQQYEVTIDIDRILKSLQDTNIKHRYQKLNISQKQFITLCRMCRNLLIKQPSLLRLNGPIFVATGTVGYYKDLAYIISKCGHPDLHNYLFLGDYIGRGDRNVQCLVHLMCLKIKLQNNFFLLRGCHDSIAMARSFNFYDQCLSRFTPKAWTEACQVLCSLPFAAVIQNQIFCCHGGLSPSLRSVEDINRITRPLQTPQVGLACDLVWADPSYKQDSVVWSASERGFGYNFHQKVAEHFLRQNRFSLLCRGHQVIYDGFYMNKQRTIATICSLANYGGIFNNSAAVLVLNPQFQAHFKVIRQREHFPMQTHFKDSASSLLKKVIEQKRQIKRKIQQQKKLKQKAQKRQLQKKMQQQILKQKIQKKEQNEQEINQTQQQDQKSQALKAQQQIEILRQRLKQKQRVRQQQIQKQRHIQKQKQKQKQLNQMKVIEEQEQKNLQDDQIEDDLSEKQKILKGNTQFFIFNQTKNRRNEEREQESDNTGSEDQFKL